MAFATQVPAEPGNEGRFGCKRGARCPQKESSGQREREGEGRRRAEGRKRVKGGGGRTEGEEGGGNG